MKERVELAVLAALFLAPAIVLWTSAVSVLVSPLQDDNVEQGISLTRAFALHAALNALALLVCTPSGLLLILARKHIHDYGARYVVDV